jgi:NAD-dependent DNA ligase
VLAQPTISDREYDRLYHELPDLEKQFPALATPIPQRNSSEFDRSSQKG